MLQSRSIIGLNHELPKAPVYSVRHLPRLQICAWDGRTAVAIMLLLFLHSGGQGMGKRWRCVGTALALLPTWSAGQHREGSKLYQEKGWHGLPPPGSKGEIGTKLGLSESQFVPGSALGAVQQHTSLYSGWIAVCQSSPKVTDSLSQLELRHHSTRGLFTAAVAAACIPVSMRTYGVRHAKGSVISKLDYL